MLRNHSEVEEFEKSWQSNEPADLHRALRLVEDSIQLARTLGVWPEKNPLEGIETDIQLARVLNAGKVD